jgi:hypothetical protein
MTTFCILCREPIPPERARRGACTCSKDHQQEYRRQRRSERALHACRLCGRKVRKPRSVEAVEPVLLKHGDSVERSELLKL